MEITVYLKDWRSRQHYTRAIDFEIEEDLGVPWALDYCFDLFNGGHGPIADRYRTAGHRSLSVGDVVIVDGQAFTCVTVGWQPADFEP